MRIKIDVSPEGDIKIEVIGGTGAECEEVTRRLEQSLGTVVDRERKPEYWASVAEQTTWLRQ